MRYLALLHQDFDASEIGVSFPDLPGCVTAGRTLAEARQLAEEALRGHLAAMGAAGLPCPSPRPSPRCSGTPSIRTPWR